MMDAFFILLVCIFSVFCFTGAIYCLVTLVDMIIDEQTEYEDYNESEQS